MENTSLEITTAERILAQELRMITTPENKVMAEEIREMMKSAPCEPMDPKFHERRQEYTVVYHYMQINLL
jgi:hypothetical protein